MIKENPYMKDIPLNQNKKNILLITTDQQSWNMMSCTGNENLRTPHMDSIAIDGIRFENAYSAHPLCIPQRCTWHTGLMPHEHKITFNEPRKAMKETLMLGQIFSRQGFVTGYSGKWHINIDPDNISRHGFQKMSNIRSNGADQAIATDFQHFLSEKDKRPFFFTASFNNPHNICQASRGDSLSLPDGAVKSPDSNEELPELPDNFMIPENEPTIIRQIQEKYKRAYPTSNWDRNRWRLHRWQYCRIVENLDKRIGDLLNILKESGYEENTLILFTSDHGEGNGHHFWNQKQTLYEESIRVPWIISRPGSLINRVDNQRLINTGIDLIPTLCNMADISCPDNLQGLATILDKDLCVNSVDRDHLVIETELGTYDKPSDAKGRSVVTHRYKYMVYDCGERREFLADKLKDPGEMTNLVMDHEYQAILEDLRNKLRNYITETKDIFPISLIG